MSYVKDPFCQLSVVYLRRGWPAQINKLIGVSWPVDIKTSKLIQINYTDFLLEK